MYVAGSVAVLFFNVIVLVPQLFHRIPALIVLAPKQMEPPFLVAELVVLTLFVWLGVAAYRGSGPHRWRCRGADHRTPPAMGFVEIFSGRRPP